MDDLLWAFKNSFIQAFFSAGFCLAFGFWFCLGLFQLQKFSPRLTRVFEYLLLVPQFLPSLFTILLALQIIDPFPIGKIGVVLVHTILYSGFAAILLKKVIEATIVNYGELAFIEGASQFLFLKRTWPLIQMPVKSIFISIFIVCFASFSVPFVVGGGKDTTLEILIYEKIRISNDWNSAVMLSVVQIMFLGICTLILRRVGTVHPTISRRKMFLGDKLSLAVMLSFAVGFLVLLTMHMLNGVQTLQATIGLAEIVKVLPTTILIGVLVGVLSWGLLLLSSWAIFFPKLEAALNFFVMPSTAFLGFALALVFGFEKLLIVVLAFEILIFTSLCRLGWFSAVEVLRKQVQVAVTLGASRAVIFKRILLPQLQKDAALYSSIAGIWMLGDFALSRTMLSQDVTLSMLIQSLMSSYRIDAAFGASGVLLFAGLLLFLVFNGVGHVLSK